MESKQEMNFRQLQNASRLWSVGNFGPAETRSKHQPLLGVAEEVGELCHAHLKSEQGIRGTPEEHLVAAADAVGDIVIFLADYCTLNGIDFQHAVEDAWTEVSKRDWKRNPEGG